MTEPIDIPPSGQRQELGCDVAVVGGGTAGTMAAITAAEMGASVLLLDKAHVLPKRAAGPERSRQGR